MAIRVAKIYGKKPIVNVYEIEDNFKDLDKNGDGKIDKKQTQIINTKNINGGAMNVYDDNGDGKANRYTEVVETAYEEKILYDNNGDGKVDRIEILDKV